jgi:hypothetical protein
VGEDHGLRAVAQPRRPQSTAAGGPCSPRSGAGCATARGSSTSFVSRASAAPAWSTARARLWRRTPLAGECSAPCIRDDAQVVRWRGDTPRDKREFYDALRQWLREETRARGDGVLVRCSGTGVALVMARDNETARRPVRGA